MAAIAANPITRLVAIGFIAGALSVFTFHQAAIALVQLVSGTAISVYPTRGIPPLGVPLILNLAFWGGLWGIAIWYAMNRFAGRWPGWLIGLVIGAVGATLVGWFVVAPIKGGPVAQGFNWPVMWRGPFINGMFGLGAALIAERLAKRM